MNKFKEFLSKKKTYLITSGVIFSFYCLMLLIGGMWPFGTNTLAHYDGYFQVVQFWGHTFDIIEGNATLVYSNLLGGGVNMVGVIFYFFLNPYSLIVLFFGRQYMYFAINIVYLLYFLTIGIVFVYFLKKKFPNLSTKYTVILSCLYTFSAYTLCNYTLTVWLNFMILMPLLFLEFEKLISQNKIVGFSIVTSLIIYSSYAVGSFMQIILICVYFIYIIITVEKENRKNATHNLLFGLLCALLLSLPLLFPVLLQLGTSCRNLIEGSKLAIPLYAGSTVLMFNLMQSILLLVAIWHLCKTFKQDKMSKFLLFALILCNLPLLFDDISQFISGGVYIHYSTRYFAINSLLLYITLGKAFSHSQKEEVQLEKDKKNFWMIYFMLGVIAIVATIVIFESYVCLGGAMSIGEIQFNEILQYIKLPLLFIASFFIIFTFFKTKSINRKLFNTLVVIFICVESFVSALCCFPTGALSTNNINAYYELTHTLGTNSRVKYSLGYIGANGNLISGVSSYSLFSSSGEESTYKLAEYLGYSDGIPDISVNGSTIFSDIMLSTDYVVTNREDLKNRSYLTLVNEFNGYYLLKYNFSLPKAFVVDKVYSDEQLMYKTNTETGEKEKLSFVESQNILAQMLGAPNKIESLIEDFTIVYDEETKVNTVTITAPSNGVLYFSNITKDKIQNMQVSIGEYSETTSNDKCVDLKEVTLNEAITFEVVKENQTELLQEEFELILLNTFELESLVDQINLSQVPVSYIKSGYSVDCTEVINKDILVIQSIPKGLEFSSNNNSSNITTKNAVFSLTLIENVNNEIISANFNYPYTKAFIVGIIAAIIGILILIVFTKKQKWLSWFKKPSYYIYIVLFIGISLWFYIFPSFLSALKILSFLV